MTIKDINKMVEKHDTLSQEEKELLSQAILNNSKARKIAIRGALVNGDFPLALKLTYHNKVKRKK